jgi:hypothetical protein
MTPTVTPVSPSKEEKLLVLALALVVLIFLAVIVIKRPRTRPPPRPLSAIALAQSWLECIDCQGPFLQRLHDLPPAARDSAVNFLSSAVRQGPDSARRNRHERELARAWVTDSVYRERVDLAEVSPTQHAAFLKRFREGLHNKWRGRSALALGVIRSPAALAALDSALQRPDTSHGDSLVRHWLERARSDSLGLEPLQDSLTWR